jgi:hypothetical protein
MAQEDIKIPSRRRGGSLTRAYFGRIRLYVPVDGRHTAGLLGSIAGSHISTVMIESHVPLAHTDWHRSASWFVRIKKGVLEEDRSDLKGSISHARVGSRAVTILGNIERR